MIAPIKKSPPISTKYKPFCHVVTTLDDRRAALQLVYQSYIGAGLIEPNASRMRVTPHHLLRTTHTFNAVRDREVIATMTLVADSPYGLPMECIFSENVAQRRTRGISVAEVTCLADLGKQGKCGFSVLVKLMGLVTQFAVRNEVDELLIAVHPRHAKFYQRFLAFEPMGDERTYPAVRNHPAIPLRMDLRRMSIDYPAANQRLFGDRFPDEDLEPFPIPDWQREYLMQFAPDLEQPPLREMQQEECRHPAAFIRGAAETQPLGCETTQEGPMPAGSCALV